MNRKAIALLASVLLGGLAGASIHAQTPNAPTSPAAVPGAPASRPATGDRTETLAKRLDLSEEQKQKVKPILDAETQKMQDLRKDENLTADERLAKFAALREETNAKLKPILTAEQYDRYLRPVAGPGSAPKRKNPAPAKPAK